MVEADFYHHGIGRHCFRSIRGILDDSELHVERYVTLLCLYRSEDGIRGMNLYEHVIWQFSWSMTLCCT